MAISNSFGKNSSSTPEPWAVLESGSKFKDLSPGLQEEIVREFGSRIKFIALRLKNRLPTHIELGDLISAGTMGLVESLAKYDAKHKIKLVTFSEARIRGAMLDELRRMDWFTRGQRRKLKVIEKACLELEQSTGRPPRAEVLAEHTGMSCSDIEQGLDALSHQVLVSYENLLEQGGALPDPFAEGDPFAKTSFNEVVDKIAQLIEELTKREQLALSLYYAEELNMKEVAQVMNVTEGRVSQLCSQAMKKLRIKMHAQFEGESYFIER